MIRVLAALAALLLAGNAEAAMRVYAKGGNIYLERDGADRELTRSGRDADPVLSPDGQFVVLTRNGASKDSTSCATGNDADLLMRIGVDGTDEMVLLRGHDSGKPEQRLCGFSGKQFNSDGRLLYFLSPAWATSSALHVYDFRGRSERFVVDANALFVLSACRDEHKDQVAVERHKYFVFGGSYDWFWLFDPVARKEVGPLGDLHGMDLTQQAQDWCPA